MLDSRRLVWNLLFGVAGGLLIFCGLAMAGGSAYCLWQGESMVPGGNFRPAWQKRLNPRDPLPPQPIEPELAVMYFVVGVCGGLAFAALGYLLATGQLETRLKQRELYIPRLGSGVALATVGLIFCRMAWRIESLRWGGITLAAVGAWLAITSILTESHTTMSDPDHSQFDE